MMSDSEPSGWRGVEYSPAPVRQAVATVGRRIDIEGLRAVAVGAVLLFHLMPAVFPGGFVGVDVFFVISGFVVTASIARRREAGTFSLLDFYDRRVRRLFPALIVVLATTLAVCWALLLRDEFVKAGLDTLLASAMALNLKLAQGTSYFDESSAQSAFLHFWSLGVEEQFYLVWPIFLVAVLLPMRHRFTTLALTVAASFVLSVWVDGRWPDVAFYTLPTRAWEFALGACLTLLGDRMVIPAGRWQTAASMMGLALIAVSVMTLGRLTTHASWLVLIPVAGAMLVIASPLSWLARRALSAGPMTWLGARSYALYLWHWLPIAMFHYWYGEAALPPALIAGIAVAAIVAAHLTHVYVERPFQSGDRVTAHWWRHAMVTPALASAAIAVGGVGLLVWRQVLPERMVGARAVLEAAHDMPQIEQHMVLDGPAQGTFLLFGDSFAEQYVPAFQRLHAEHRPNQLRLELFTRGGCAPFPRISRRADRTCVDFVSSGFRLARREDVSRVLIVASWAGFLRRGDHFDAETGKPVDPTSPESAYVWQAFESELATLVRLGKKVNLVLAPPGGDAADPTWIARRPTLAKPIPLAVYEAETSTLNARLIQIARRVGAETLHPKDWLCKADGCPVITPDGQPIFYDETHLRASWVWNHMKTFDPLALANDHAATHVPATPAGTHAGRSGAGAAKQPVERAQRGRDRPAA